jgi:hypothetical protein
LNNSWVPQDVYIHQDAAAVADDDYAEGNYNLYDKYCDGDFDGETVPEGANLEVDERQFAAGNDNALEMATIESSKSRIVSIRSVLSRT